MMNRLAANHVVALLPLKIAGDHLLYGAIQFAHPREATEKCRNKLLVTRQIIDERKDEVRKVHTIVPKCISAQRFLGRRGRRMFSRMMGEAIDSRPCMSVSASQHFRLNFR